MFILLLSINAKSKYKSSLGQAGSRVIAGLLFLLICTALCGCSLTVSDSLTKNSDRPKKALVGSVPFFAQDELQCGPASLAMVLSWGGVNVAPSDLSPEVFTPGLNGSLQASLIGSARRHGRVAYPIKGFDDLVAEISAGHPAIVLVNLGFSWFPQWHYAVAIGYDLDNEVVILHSGLTANEVMSSWTFKNIWRRSQYWGLLVLPPDQMPETVEQNKWLSAVAGLENARQWDAAALGYITALKLWDKSFIAWMGLGNSLYNQNNLVASTEAFERAAELQPENGMAYNNLAHVLAEQGRLDEALAAARRAVAIGGPFQETFSQTLEEVELMLKD